jgi:hypothetical protein
MSIIHEALKKARHEQTSVPTGGTQEEIRKNLKMEIERSASRRNWGPLFVIVVLVLITGPIVAPAILAPFKNAAPSAPSSPADRTVDRKKQFRIEEAGLFRMAAPAGAKMPGLRLSGIVYSPKEAYCIINDSILKVGDSVSGAVLTSVTAQSVTLDHQGKQVTLNLV